MAKIHVHEFISLDGVIENPGWTFDYGFDPNTAAGLRDLGRVGVT